MIHSSDFGARTATSPIHSLPRSRPKAMCKRSQQRGATRTRTGPGKSQFWIGARPESPGNPASSSGAAQYGPLRSWVVQSVLWVSSVMYPAGVFSFLPTKYSQPSGIARFCASFIALDRSIRTVEGKRCESHTVLQCGPYMIVQNVHPRLSNGRVAR